MGAVYSVLEKVDGKHTVSVVEMGIKPISRLSRTLLRTLRHSGWNPLNPVVHEFFFFFCFVLFFFLWSTFFAFFLYGLMGHIPGFAGTKARAISRGRSFSPLCPISVTRDAQNSL